MRNVITLVQLITRKLDTHDKLSLNHISLRSSLDGFKPRPGEIFYFLLIRIFSFLQKKLLCRQLHEAESLMMVQKLDWDVKLKELHMYDSRAAEHVPIIEVPSDFPLFVHDPIQRPS